MFLIVQAVWTRCQGGYNRCRGEYQNVRQVATGPIGWEWIRQLHSIGGRQDVAVLNAGLALLDDSSKKVEGKYSRKKLHR